MIFYIKGEEAGAVKIAARSDIGVVYRKKQVDHDIRSHIRRSKRSPLAIPTRNLNAIIYEEMRDEGGGEFDAEDTNEDREPDGDDDVIHEGLDNTKFLINAKAREEDPSLEEISALLQKIIRGKSKN